MSLQAAIGAALPDLRREAEGRMTARAAIRRKSGNRVPDEDGYEVDEWLTVHADLPCYVAASGQGTSGTRAVTIGSSEVQVATRLLRVPASTTDLRDGDYADILSGACAGLAFLVVEATLADHKKQQDLPVVQVQRPEEWA